MLYRRTGALASKLKGGGRSWITKSQKEQAYEHLVASYTK